MEKIELTQPQQPHFVELALSHGGNVTGTGFTNYSSHFPAYCNPSIYFDEYSGKWLLNQRSVSYFIHSSKDNFDSWGPLHYVIQTERFNWLETENYIGVSDNPHGEYSFKKIDMKERKHQWEFHGLEDIRLVRWNGTLYGIGVRRDDNPTGVGRMELCELDDNTFAEVSSVRIDAPNPDTYCVKNWMPIADMPYCFIDSTDPLRIVKCNPLNGSVEVIVEKPKKNLLPDFDFLRGSSQCIPYRGGHLCIVHTCQMWYTGNSRKYARYLHAFVFFNRDWDVQYVSPLFSFNDMLIEFCCGLQHRDGNFFISFALQDNMSYVLSVPDEIVWKFLTGTDMPDAVGKETGIWSPSATQEQLFNYAMHLYGKKDYAGAYTWFEHIVDRFPYAYNERYMLARTVADMGHRDTSEIGLWILCIESDPERPEGYMGAAAYYKWRGHFPEGGYFAKKAMQKYAVNTRPLFYYTDEYFTQIYKDIMKETQWYDAVDRVSKAKRAF